MADLPSYSEAVHSDPLPSPSPSSPSASARTTAATQRTIMFAFPTLFLSMIILLSSALHASIMSGERDFLPNVDKYVVPPSLGKPLTISTISLSLLTAIYSVRGLFGLHFALTLQVPLAMFSVSWLVLAGVWSGCETHSKGVEAVCPEYGLASLAGDGIVTGARLLLMWILTSTMCSWAMWEGRVWVRPKLSAGHGWVKGMMFTCRCKNGSKAQGNIGYKPVAEEGDYEEHGVGALDADADVEMGVFKVDDSDDDDENDEDVV